MEGHGANIVACKVLGVRRRIPGNVRTAACGIRSRRDDVLHREVNGAVRKVRREGGAQGQVRAALTGVAVGDHAVGGSGFVGFERPIDLEPCCLLDADPRRTTHRWAIPFESKVRACAVPAVDFPCIATAAVGDAEPVLGGGRPASSDGPCRVFLGRRVEIRGVEVIRGTRDRGLRRVGLRPVVARSDGMVTGFLRGVVGGGEGQVRKFEREPTDVEGCEFDQEVEFGGDHRHVRRANRVPPRVGDVEAPGGALERCSTVAGGEGPIDVHGVAHHAGSARVVHRHEANRSDLHRRVPFQGADAC